MHAILAWCPPLTAHRSWLHRSLLTVDAQAQDRLELRSTYTRIDKRGTRLQDQNVTFLKFKTPDGVEDHFNKDDWRGAQVADITAQSGVRVTGNDRKSVDTATPMLLIDSDRRYRMFDDELAHLDESAHDTNILSIVLWPLYVRVDTAVTSAPPQYRPFKRYLTSVTQKSWLGVHVNDEHYWSVPLVLAFEFGSANDEGSVGDYDPGDNSLEHEGPVSGVAAPDTDQPVVAVFTEAIHDFKETHTGVCPATVPVVEYLASTQAHEVLHALRVPHGGDLGSGVVMCANLKNDASVPTSVRWQLTPSQKARVRGLIRPSTREYPKATDCPHRPGCGANDGPSLEAEEGDLP